MVVLTSRLYGAVDIKRLLQKQQSAGFSLHVLGGEMALRHHLRYVRAVFGQRPRRWAAGEL